MRSSSSVSQRSGKGFSKPAAVEESAGKPLAPAPVISFLYYRFCITSVEFVTVSARVSREVWVKAKKYGVNVSEVIRRALEEEVRRRELEWALSVMEDIAERARLEKPSWQIIREFRDKL